jgi:hypothetical protein
MTDELQAALDRRYAEIAALRRDLPDRVRWGDAVRVKLDELLHIQLGLTSLLHDLDGKHSNPAARELVDTVRERLSELLRRPYDA